MRETTQSEFLSREDIALLTDNAVQRPTIKKRLESLNIKFFTSADGNLVVPRAAVPAALGIANNEELPTEDDGFNLSEMGQHKKALEG